MKSQSASRIIAWSLLVTGLSSRMAAAGVILFAGNMQEDGTYKPHVTDARPSFQVRYSAIAVTVSNGTSRVTVRDTLAPATDTSYSCMAIAPLPADVSTTGVRLSVEIDGRMTQVATQVLTAEKAMRLLESLASGTRQPSLLSYAGRPLAVAAVFPQSASESTAQLTYSQTLSSVDGLALFACPLPSGSLGREAVSRVSLNLELAMEHPLRGMFSPSHECTIERPDLHRAVVRMSIDDWDLDDDFRLCYVAAKDPMGLRVLAHRPDNNEDGFFVLFGNPTSGAEGAASAKDIIFVLDKSGSMRGEKMEQARSAISHCLQGLNPDDRFNIVAFSTETETFKKDVVPVSAASLVAAEVFIDELVPMGRTNIRAALVESMSGVPHKRRPRIVIFLTDGTPTAGEMDPAKILKDMAEINESSARVFAMGMGHNVNSHLLEGIAESSHGSTEFVGPDEEIDVKIAALYNRLSHPFLTDVSIDFGELKTASVFPKELPALFKGTQLLVAGRYKQGGKATIHLRGERDGEARDYVVKTQLPESTDDNAFVAPLWATRSIGFYLREMRLHGESDELIQEVVKLSRRFGIMTEYTEFMANEPALAMDGEASQAEASRLLQQASEEHSGKWAFFQARNDKGMRERTAVSSKVNSYVDRDGKLKEADNIRQVGNTAYFKNEGRWVESAEASPEPSAERPSRIVQQFSQEYFDLIRTNKKFAAAQSLDGLMTVNIGDEIVEVR